MYAILNAYTNEISDFETRNVQLTELVHEDFRHLYIEIPDNHTLKIGDIWHNETQSWEISDLTTEFPEEQQITIQPKIYQPTNAEIAQMISDLYADLIINGVISQ